MKVEVHSRKIYYDFTFEEVDFLKSLGLWEEVLNRMKDYEVIIVEGYERVELE